MTEQQQPQPWRLIRRVLPQHTDHAGVMWHGAYLAWLEEARVEALAAVGLAYSDLSAQGLELPLVHVAVDYKQALLHGDVHLLCCVLPHVRLRLELLVFRLGRALRQGQVLAPSFLAVYILADQDEVHEEQEADQAEENEFRLLKVTQTVRDRAA